MKKIYQKISKCRISNDKNLIKVFDFKNIKLTGIFPKSKKEIIKSTPLEVVFSKKSKLLQLNHNYNFSSLFGMRYGYRSALNKSMVYHLKKKFNKLNKKLKFNSSDRVLDIGSNDGSLLEIAKKKGFKVLGVEPTNTAKISIKKGINTIKKSLNFNLAKKIVNKYSKFDFIIANNFFAQTNNLIEIIKSIKLILKKKGILIIEVQYLYDLLSQKGFDSFHHEHIAYYTTSSIVKLLEMYEIFVFNVEKLKVHGGLIRVYASLHKRPLTKNLKKLLNKEKNDKNIIKKIKYLNSFRIKFNKKIKNLFINLKNREKIIYAIGAAPRSCVLLNSSNLSKKEISLVGEVPESLKCNKYVPGTDIIVKDENRIISDKPDYVIILAWHLKNRIIKLLRKKEYKGNFIVPLPNLKIIKKKYFS